MLFKNFNDPNLDYSINEGNFISSDITTIFDTDAGFRLSELTIDKLFEGLDIEKSESMHSFIKSNIPSLTSIMGKDKSEISKGIDLIRSQFTYIENQINLFEQELASGFQQVMSATKTQGVKGSVKKISQITNPSGISSIIPKIDEVVKMAKKNNIADFNSESLKQSFLSLYNVDVLNIVKQTLLSVESSSSTVGLKDLYTIIDKFDLEKIESDSASTYPSLLIGSSVDLTKMMESTDVYDRFASFTELVMMKFPFGKTLTDKFGANYVSIKTEGAVVGPDAILALRQFYPAADISVFEPLSELLNEVGSLLIKRVFSGQPEHTKNIFTPALQVMFLCMIVLLALKLINLNIEVEIAGIQKEQEIKKEAEAKAYETKVSKAKQVVLIGKELESLQFFTRGGVVYKVGSTKMSPNVVKLINNFLVLMKYLDSNKINDTNYDTITANAVTQYQTEYGLRLKDGKIGNETKADMQDTIKEIASKYKIDATTLSPEGITGIV